MPTDAENFTSMDHPVPGESLVQPKGQAKYEMPPQFNDLEKALDYFFDRVTNEKNAKDILNLMDSGVPIDALVTPILMQAASEGKINMDLAMLVAQPLSMMLVGLGKQHGVDPTLNAERKEKSVDTTSIRKMFDKQGRGDEIPPASEEPSLDATGGFLKRPE